MNDFWFFIFEWMVYGYVIGIIINLLDREEARYGVIGTTIFGMLGAVFGGLVAHSLFGMEINAFTFHGVLAAITGAIVISIVERLAFRINHYPQIPKLPSRDKYFFGLGR